MKKICSRSVSLVSGFIMMLCYGLLYAWSIYSSPLSQEFGWSSARLGLCFTLIMIAFCLGGILGSLLTKRFGCGRAILTGAVMSLAGYVCSSFLSAGTLWLLYASFFVSGLGCGIVYNATVSAVVMRFPDKKGFASGILLMGFGASTLVFGSIASGLMALPAAGWRTVFRGTGVLLFAAGLLGRRFIVSDPPEKTAVGSCCAASLTPAQMMSTADFWLFFASASILSFFGQGIIGHAKSIAIEGGVPAALTSLTVGLTSVANGLGRIFFGTLHDKKGYRFTLTLDALVLIIAGLIAFFFLPKNAPAVIITALMLCGLGYGAVPPIASSVTQEFFGPEHYAQNFSLTNLNIIIASFASTIMGNIQTSTGSYSTALLAFALLEIVPIVLLTVLSHIRNKKYVNKKG